MKSAFPTIYMDLLNQLVDFDQIAWIHCWEGRRLDKVLVTLTLFLRSHQHFGMSNFDQNSVSAHYTNDGFWPNFIFETIVCVFFMEMVAHL